MDYKLSIHNKRIFNFYASNNLNFELFNLLFIDILEKIQDISVSNIHDFLEKNIGNTVQTTIKSQSNINKLSNIVKTQYKNGVQMCNEEKSQIRFSNNNIDILLDSRDDGIVDLTNDTVIQFNNDCIINKCNGILFSQYSGIIDKMDFEIQIHNKNVLLYVHNSGYEPDKIKMAITIVENLKSQIDVFFTEGDNSIPVEMLDGITNEYLVFKSKKEVIIKIIKENGEIMAKMLDNLNLPNLESYLSPINICSGIDTTTELPPPIINCQYCNKTVKKSILQHYRHCKSKIDIDNITSESSCDNMYPTG